MGSESGKRIRELELAGRYVFHGSGFQLQCLEPRQAFTYSTGSKELDGPPAVFASDAIDFAIFMSIINPSNCKPPYGSSCQNIDGELIFGASQSALDQLSEKSTGYANVFDRDIFEHRGGREWWAFSQVTPIEVIQVNWTDFEPEVKLIDLRSLGTD